MHDRVVRKCEDLPDDAKPGDRLLVDRRNVALVALLIGAGHDLCRQVLGDAVLLGVRAKPAAESDGVGRGSDRAARGCIGAVE
jgi:hypothetical protein